MKKSIHVICLLVLFPLGVIAAYALPTLQELISGSDVILTGTVSTKRTLETMGTRTFIKAWIKPDRILKGTPPKQEKIEVFAQETASGAVSSIEEPLSPFPEKGAKVLLFLILKNDTLSPYSGRGSVFEVFMGNGLTPDARFSLNDVEEALKKSPPAKK